VLDACALLHIRDPQEFQDMPRHLQELWLEHVENLWTGAYASKDGGGKQTHAEAMALQAAAIERMQGRG
jgi:hypothetical protein